MPNEKNVKEPKSHCVLSLTNLFREDVLKMEENPMEQEKVNIRYKCSVMCASFVKNPPVVDWSYDIILIRELMKQDFLSKMGQKWSENYKKMKS